ncbi:MAG: hypothetical protein HDT48_00500 [Ruminococcaceae bacterium]|nr:hypothetical protein [Oscillospiraceae bacterium]
MNFKKTIAAAAVSALAVTAFAVSASAETAGLIFQTNAWTFRNNINQSQAIWWDPDFGDAMNFDTWNVNDVEITADGTYTVSFEKNVMEDCKDGPEQFWNFLKLQTDISAAEYPDVQITIDSLKVDGNEIAAAKTATQGSDKVAKDDYSDIASVKEVSDGYLVGFYNTWNPEETVISSEDFGGKVECTFTITGYKAAEAAAPAEEAEAPAASTGDTNTAGADKSNADTGVEGVAAIAGIAIIAAGAIVIAKKRK